MVCLLVGVPAISYAHDYGCATVGASMESSLFDAIKNDLNIDVATIIKDKTKVEILDISPVSKVYAESLARMDYEKDKALNLQSKCNKKRSTHQLEYNFVSTQKPFPNDEYFLPTSYNKR
ncbi:hypothetical protein OVZ97_24385, partial [Salmonella enterica subsp. enterica serovar 1,4,[5],12:i:-]|nr:hypothetical protein [Salmonella enterica subsp. enterica serovar 1,4,[5],12:i:-]